MNPSPVSSPEYETDNRDFSGIAIKSINVSPYLDNQYLINTCNIIS